MFIIVGEWVVILSEIAAYTYERRAGKERPHLAILLKSGNSMISGYVAMSTIDEILSYWKSLGETS